jgi:hypothetical protein
MKNRVLFLMVASIMLFKCKSSTKVEGIEQDPDLSKRLVERFFSLEHKVNDQDFIFAKSNRWDTSYVFMAHQQFSGKIRGTYYEISPSNGFYSLDRFDLLFFEGFSCDIDSAKFAQILMRSSSLLKTLNKDIDTGCLDCTNYFLTVGYRTTISNTDEGRRDMEQFSAYLKETLIYPVLRIKNESDSLKVRE